MEPINEHLFLVANEGELGRPRLFAIVDLHRRHATSNLLSLSHFLVREAGPLVTFDGCLHQLAVDFSLVVKNQQWTGCG